ncbi:MAG: AAA family ATPase [Actinomycetota bacterium]|nr:AAA family ATPase [Actinomycetota bacterium]
MLTTDQLAAVATPMSVARVIAPAGSGKNRVLTARVRYLVADRGYEPELVTAVAYNNRAAAEMRHRLADLPDPQVRTIHALGFEIVRAARPEVGLIGERETRDVIARLAAFKPQPNTDVYAPYLEALAQVRLGLRDPAEVARTRGDVVGLAQLFDRYRQTLTVSTPIQRAA